jgi:predicted phage terminase large subunit-like protein
MLVDNLTDPAAEEDLAVFLEEARQDLLFYVQVCEPTYIVSKMHALLAQKYQAIIQGVIDSKAAGRPLPNRPRRLIVTVPPRTGKTKLFCIEGATWGLGKDSSLEFAVASYNESMPRDSSVKARARINDPTYQRIFDTRIAEGNARIQRWALNGGGRYQAVGVGGGLTGTGVDVLLLDDLVKDFEEAHSQTRLDTIWNWYFSTARTRLPPWGAIVFIMTRWSTDDPVGRQTNPEFLKRLAAAEVDISDERFEIINLPALAHGDGKDPLGRKEGESVFPERWTADHYRKLKATTLSYIWSAMYDGNPVITGGNYIPVAQFQIVDPSEVPADLRWCRAWDLATSSKQTSDETASPAGAIAPNGDFYIRDMVHGRWDWPEARGRIQQLSAAERIPIGIEAVAGFMTAFQNVVEVLPPSIMCLPITVSKDKLTRALPWVALVAKKKVKLVRGAWNIEFLTQAERFTGKDGDEDDQVDGVSLVYQMCNAGPQFVLPVNINDRLRNAHNLRANRTLVG